MARHRSHSVEFKRQVAQEYLGGETIHGLARRHDLSRNLVRVWVEKMRARCLRRGREHGRPVPGLRGTDRCARTPGGQAGAGARASEAGAALRGHAEKQAYLRHHWPRGLSVAQGCRLMGIARCTVYGPPSVETDDTALVEAISAITGEFEAYGWRRVRAALRQQGIVANHKKVRRLMREHDLQPRMRGRTRSSGAGRRAARSGCATTSTSHGRSPDGVSAASPRRATCAPRGPRRMTGPRASRFFARSSPIGQPRQEARMVGIAAGGALHAVLGKLRLHGMPQREIDDRIVPPGIDIALVAHFAAIDPVLQRVKERDVREGLTRLAGDALHRQPRMQQSDSTELVIGAENAPYPIRLGSRTQPS